MTSVFVLGSFACTTSYAAGCSEAGISKYFSTKRAWNANEKSGGKNSTPNSGRCPTSFNGLRPDKERGSDHQCKRAISQLLSRCDVYQSQSAIRAAGDYSFRQRPHARGIVRLSQRYHTAARRRRNSHLSET